MQTTTIALPTKRTEKQDSEGFVTESWEYLKNIRASIKDATRSDKLLANQCGYEAEIIVEIAKCVYNGASFFVNESDGIVYDIQRSYAPEKAFAVQLTGSRRENGKI